MDQRKKNILTFFLTLFSFAIVGTIIAVVAIFTNINDANGMVLYYLLTVFGAGAAGFIVYSVGNHFINRE